MAGFGSLEYGGAKYGSGHVTTPVIATTAIVVYPTTALVGERITIGSIGGDLLDLSRDDAFTETTLNTSLWTPSSTGVATITFQEGLNIELQNVGGGSSYTLTSIDSYVEGDISIEYQILSYSGTDNPTNPLIYAGLAFDFTNGSTFIITRTFVPGFGHQILVTDTQGNTASLRTTAIQGTLRLVKRGTQIAAYYNDQLLMGYKSHADVGFTTRLFTTTNNQATYLKSRFNNYHSSTGVHFGSDFMVTKNIELDTRIVGLLSASTQVGTVDIIAFNHLGIVGSAIAGFTYPLITGRALSGNAGLSGSIQADVVLR